MKSCDFPLAQLHIISRRAKFYSLLSQFFQAFQFFSKALNRPASRHCSVLLHLLSLALTESNSRHCSMFSTISPPGFLALGHDRFFAIFTTFLDVNSYSLSFSFMLCASDNLYLKTLDQCPRTFDIANTNECFSDIPPRKDGIPWISCEAYLETPLLHPQSLCRQRSLGQSYADVITKFSRLDGLPFFINHGALLVRFTCLSSTSM